MLVIVRWFDSMIKKLLTPKTTKDSTHHAPAGHKTAHPTTVVCGPLAATEHEGAPHEGIDVGTPDLASEGSDDYSEVDSLLTAEEVKKRGAAFASSVKFIAAKYPDAKEAALCLVDAAVEKIARGGRRLGCGRRGTGGPLRH